MLMEWPYRRFLKAYDAFQRRILCDEWRARKYAHLNAMRANSNFADNPKEGFVAQQALDELERNYDVLIARIWNGGDGEVTQKEDAAMTTPFMRASKRAIASIKPPSLPGQSQIEALPQT